MITTCENLGCSNKVRTKVFPKRVKIFCESCKFNLKGKTRYVRTVLRIQADCGMLIRDALLDSCKTFKFHSAEYVASALLVSRQTLIHLIQENFGINSWGEFKKQYHCKSNSCIALTVSDLSEFSHTNKYYFIDKLKSKFNICSCLFTLLSHEVYSDRKHLYEKDISENILIRLVDIVKVSDLHKFLTLESSRFKRDLESNLADGLIVKGKSVKK